MVDVIFSCSVSRTFILELTVSTVSSVFFILPFILSTRSSFLALYLKGRYITTNQKRRAWETFTDELDHSQPFPNFHLSDSMILTVKLAHVLICRKKNHRESWIASWTCSSIFFTMSSLVSLKDNIIHSIISETRKTRTRFRWKSERSGKQNLQTKSF